MPLLFRGMGDPLFKSPLRDECWLDSLRFVLVLLVTGDSGISCASGWATKFVMASMTSTRGGRVLADDGVMLGELLVAGSARS